MKPADRLLLDDVIGDAAREQTLRRAGRVLRRRRVLRRAAYVLPPALAAAASLLVLMRPPVTAPAPAVVPPAARGLTDDQLLALFPGVPRALVTVKGEQRLVFTRPADAARYVGRAPR